MTNPKMSGNGLTAKDFESLRDCFISPEQIEKSGICRVDDEKGAELLNRKRNANSDFSGLDFPFRNVRNGNSIEHNIRLDKPLEDLTKGVPKKNKYLLPSGSKPLAYFPPSDTPELLADSHAPCILTEGAKKALAIENALTDNLAKPLRSLVIAFPGVDGYKYPQTVTKANGAKIKASDVLPELKEIEFDGREVLIIYDTNVLTNKNVYFARHRLAQTLIALGAVVYFVTLPLIDGVNGIDDLLGLWERNSDRETAIKNFHELLEKKRRFVAHAVFSRPLCNENLILKIENGERNKLKVSALDSSGKTVNLDQFNLTEAAKRDAFIKKQIEPAFSPTEKDKQEISAELIRLGVLAEIVTAAEQIKKETDDEPIEVSFKVLSDGRIIEQIRGGFALYEPDTGNYSIVDSTTDENGSIYIPVKDALFNSEGGLFIADGLIEYGTTAELDKDIENYLSTYIDLKPLQLQLTAKYIRFTYLFDKTMELSYLNPTGHSGSGKSRFGLAVTIASRRGLLLSDASASSIFRTVDRCKPTLFIDEFNNNEQTDDAAAVVKILNTGFQALTKIPRVVKNSDGNFDTELFDPYCPKIIGALKQSASNAFNSRCNEIEMERTARNNIPIRLKPQMLEAARILRNKLSLYRLRAYNDDFEQKLDAAEDELKKSGIMPRSIQVNIPLFAMIDGDDTRKKFINLLKDRDDILVEEKLQSLDGEIVDKIHTLLFEVEEDQEDNRIAKWHSLNFPEPPEQDELCEELRVEKLLEMLNYDRKKKEISSQYFGKLLSGLHIKTKKILTHKSSYRQKKAIIFDYERLGYLFKIHNLPVTKEFNVTNVTELNNSNNDNDLPLVTNETVSVNSNGQRHQVKLTNNNSYENGDIGDIESVKYQGSQMKCKKFDCLSLMDFVPQENIYFCGMCLSQISVE